MTMRTYGQTSGQLFPKRWPHSNQNRTKSIMNKHKVKHHRNSDSKTGNRDHIRTTAFMGVNQKVLPVLSTETLLHIWLSTEYYGCRPSSTAVDMVSLHALDPTVPRKRMQIGFLLASIVKEVSNSVSNLLMSFLLQKLSLEFV